MTVYDVRSGTSHLTPEKKKAKDLPSAFTKTNVNEDYFAPRIASLAALATRNLTTRLALI